MWNVSVIVKGIGRSPPLQRCSQTAAALPAHLSVSLAEYSTDVNKTAPLLKTRNGAAHTLDIQTNGMV